MSIFNKHLIPLAHRTTFLVTTILYSCRPYDIGDRIVIVSNPGDLNDGSIQKSWVVEGTSPFYSILQSSFLSCFLSYLT